MTYILIITIMATLILGFNYLIRRSLAPTRTVESMTPEDLNLKYNTVRITTDNSQSLYGWFIPAHSSSPAPAVVLVHGWGGNSATLLPLAPSLHKAGFSQLLFDTRCHGQSDEDSFTSMPRFAEDLEHVINWLKIRADIDTAHIAVIGHSVGAGAALMVAAGNRNLTAVVSIAAFAHPAAMMRRLLTSVYVPYFPIGWYILRYVEWVIGYRFDDIAPIRTISHVQCPTLLVHGEQDHTVPVEEAYAIYAARGLASVQLHLIPGSHDDYGNVERHTDVLITFLKDNI